MERLLSNCPRCDVDLRGLPMPEGGYYGRQVGMEVPGLHDGSLFWICPDCNWAWPRRFLGQVLRQELSREQADKYNAAHTEPVQRSIVCPDCGMSTIEQASGACFNPFCDTYGNRPDG